MKIQDTEEESEHVQLLKVSQNGRKMAVVFGKSGFLSNRLHIYDVEKNIEGSIAFKTNHRNETLRNSKITSFCWTDDQSANEFVYSSVSERLLRPGFITRSSQFTLADVKNGFKSTITDFTQINAITTNCNTSSEKLIAIGESSGRVCLYQNRTFQRKWHLESSPQVLKFSKAIVLTDLRMRKTVVEYYGHVNNHSKLKFHLNSSEDYLFAAGSDSLLRFWTVKSGELFQERNINTEQSMSIPQLVYSSRWSGDDSLSGILCCDRNNYIFWPFL